MTITKSLAAYSDCEDYFERALQAPRGLAVTLDSSGMATRFRQRMNYYRVLLRKQSKEIRPQDDPQWGQSPYDGLELVLDKDNPHRVLIRRQAIKVAKVEEI